MVCRRNGGANESIVCEIGIHGGSQGAEKRIWYLARGNGVFKEGAQGALVIEHPLGKGQIAWPDAGGQSRASKLLVTVKRRKK